METLTLKNKREKNANTKSYNTSSAANDSDNAWRMFGYNNVSAFRKQHSSDIRTGHSQKRIYPDDGVKALRELHVSSIRTQAFTHSMLSRFLIVIIQIK